MAQSPLDLQLKETSQLTGASRAIWLEHSVEWEILAAYHLSSREKQAVLKGIQRPEMQAWIEAAFTASHPRSRSGDGLAGFEAGRIHLFADQMTQRVILVGADHLSSVAQRFWQFVAVGNISRPFLEPSADPFLSSKDLAIPYHLPEALARILDLLLRTAGCKAGWLAIRSGDYFEIRAEQGCGDWTDKRISIEANPLLRDLLHNCRGEIVQKEAADWAMVPRIGYNERACSWAALPLVIGSRLIGLAGIWLEEPLQNEVWTVLKQLTRKIAPSVEASITFSDLTNQLRRMALLNDFAVTITSALNPEQIAQRMFALLRRAFGTDRIHLNILSSDGSVLSNYVEHEGTVTMNAVLPEKGHIPWLVQKGEVYRVDAIGQAGEYSPVYEGSQSTLVIPLKFRRQIIGA